MHKTEGMRRNRTRPFPPGVALKWAGAKRATLQTKIIVSLSAGAVKASGCASRNRRQINVKHTRISRRSFPAHAGYAPAGFAPFKATGIFSNSDCGKSANSGCLSKPPAATYIKKYAKTCPPFPPDELICNYVGFSPAI